MNRRCAVYWMGASICFIVSATAHYQGGLGGIDGVFLMLALAAVLGAIVTHCATGRSL